MKRKIVIFLDSDVIISSLISEKGAAFSLVHNQQVAKYISNYSFKEISIVIKRLKLNLKNFKSILTNLKIVTVNDKLKDIKESYNKFVIDKNDSHIICGAKEAKVNFLITYNIKNYRKDIIKQNLKIITLTPALFLQYLRSL